MRKSERIRLLEMQVVKLEFQLELANHMLAAIMEQNNLAMPELDAGKWYKKRLKDLD